MEFPFPLILCDVGGTNVRTAIVETPGAEPQVLAGIRTADFEDLGSALETLLATRSVRPESALICAAGPVEGWRVKLTNADWSLNGPEIAARCGLKKGLLLNDFEAQALSLPVLRPEWCRPIIDVSDADGPSMVHGPGTGLGTACLLRVENRWLSLASEASHSDFAPVSAAEQKLWPFIEPVHGRVTPEALISGPGIRRLHRARLAAVGRPRPADDERAIVAAGLFDPAGEAAQTLRMFWLLAARFCGDLALAFLARGGVTLSGGILPRLLPLLDPLAFRSAFVDKAPYGDLMRQIPVRLITAPDTVLVGMAHVAARPSDYLIDYRTRVWS